MRDFLDKLENFRMNGHTENWKAYVVKHNYVN